MPIESEAYSLQLGPNDLCFSKNEFVKDNFSVDQFLQDHRKRANLETMRDDLGIYLKFLNSAMIELINKDYADFVNLSSNLIGMDKSISGIQVPLGQLREEVFRMKISLEEMMADLSTCLEQRQILRERKRGLINLSKVQSSLKKLSNILDGEKYSRDSSSSQEFLLESSLLERAASEFILLQFSLSKSLPDMADIYKKDSEGISETIRQRLDQMFVRSLQVLDRELMSNCLRIYAMMDQISEAENLFQKQVVAQSMQNIICENFLESDPQKLKGIYNKILFFIESQMKDLLEISGRIQSAKGFEFLLNSFWPEVEQLLETNLYSIFVPGNIDVFYERYSVTLEFLSSLEKYFETRSSVRKFHQHPQYVAFTQKWNLSVYFQSRFQEIAGEFENCLSKGCLEPANSEKTGNFFLLETQTAWKCLMRCWGEGVFIFQISHRFLKLSFQILSRYCTWIASVLKKHSSGDSGLSSKLQFLVCLHQDTGKLADKVPELADIIRSHLQPLSLQSINMIEGSLKESQEQLLSQMPLVSQYIVTEVSRQCLNPLRQVSDIPRLFRRTNRDIPSKPCSYVAAALIPPQNFAGTQAGFVPQQLMQQWLKDIFSETTIVFRSSVSDVLVSIQKTEETLRRLKKNRDRGSSSTSDGDKGFGDDHKIRLQLALDVQSYCDGIEALLVNRQDVTQLKDLIQLVEGATKLKSTQKPVKV